MELYVHIPFCVRKCAYCDFLSAPACDETIDRYADALEEEIRNKAACLPGEEVESIFFGGGTPSLLPADRIGRLMDVLRTCYRILPDAEISMECNPGTVTGEKLAVMREAGINRLSFGLQTCQDTELARLGRIHSFRDFLDGYGEALAAGFANLNVDLIYGFPGQTAASFADSLQKVCRLKPTHLSVYRLIIEEGTPFYDAYHRDELRRDAGEKPDLLPTEEEEDRMEAALQEILMGEGYLRYEISNYARLTAADLGKEESGLPEYACRHNIGYWTGVPYLGLGLGASSCLGGDGARRFRNTEDLEAYLAGDRRPRDVVLLTEQMQMEEFMFLGLRMLRGVSKADFCRRFDQSMEDVYGDVLSGLTDQGLLEQRAGRVRLTEKGLCYGNRVFSAFL